MRPVKVETPQYEFTMDAYGMFTMDIKNPVCPEESGFHGTIRNQQDRVALARFLGDVSRALATPKLAKPVLTIHNPKFDTELLMRSLS